MIAKEKLLKAIEISKELSITSGLTDEQVAWVKNKVAQIDNLVNIAQANFAAINTRLSTLETKATQFQTALTNLAKRVTALENKL